jgi:hypothetical protein
VHTLANAHNSSCVFSLLNVILLVSE